MQAKVIKAKGTQAKCIKTKVTKAEVIKAKAIKAKAIKAKVIKAKVIKATVSEAKDSKLLILSCISKVKGPKLQMLNYRSETESHTCEYWRVLAGIREY